MPIPPLSDVKNTATGQVGWVHIDLGDNVSVWLDGPNGSIESELWRRENVVVIREQQSGRG